MAQFGKASAKRSRPGYFMAILGVSLVLFIFGLFGWIAINTRNLENYFKETVPMQVFLRETMKAKEKDQLQEIIKSLPQVKSYRFVDKESARKDFIAEGNEDFAQFVDSIILPTSFDLTLHSQFVVKDSMNKLALMLQQNPAVTEVKFPDQIVGNMKIVKVISYGLLGVAVILGLIAIILIDNTIRLAMFSNRFLIKTMQMVGATRWFIAKPMDIRALINGAIAALISIALLWALLGVFWGWLPELKALHEPKSMFILFFVMLLMGVLITLLSTHRSVIKYLKMKLDDLY
jgi:cell division transport system permease protein